MSPGDFVQTPDGPGVIISIQSAREFATVKLDDGEVRSYPLNQLTLTETGEPPIVPKAH
jgi:hypothetical protein